MAGARFGYALIFTLVFAAFTALILQGMTGRLALGSGLDLAQCLREFPQKKVSRVFFIILTLSSITLGCAAYEAGNIIGGSLGLEMVSSLSRQVWVILIACTAIVILSFQRYKWVEKFLIFLVFLMSASFITTMIIVRPHPVSILKGFIPSLPPGSLYLVLALIGTTVVPYNLFLHSAAVRQKWSSPSDMRTVWKDLFLSIGLGGLISISIIITSAVAFHEKGIPLESGTQLSEQLKPLFRSSADLLFGFGFFAAGLSSALTAPYAAAFASAGILGWKRGQRSPGFRAVWLGVILSGVIVSLFNLNPLVVIVFAQAANGIILPVASVFLLIVLNSRRRMGTLTNSLRQNLLGGFVILVVSILGLWSLFKLFF